MSKESSFKTLRVEAVFDAPREKVFEAWSSKERLKKWFIPCEPGAKLTGYEADVRVGGRYRIEVLSAEKSKDVISGSYTEVKPPERLVYSMELKEGRPPRKDDTPIGKTVVHVALREVSGRTEAVVTQEPFPTAKSREIQAKGWNACLKRLAQSF